MIVWDLMAFSAQTGYFVPLKSTLQLQKLKLMRKFKILRWEYIKWNHYN